MREVQIMSLILVFVDNYYLSQLYKKFRPDATDVTSAHSNPLSLQLGMAT